MSKDEQTQKTEVFDFSITPEEKKELDTFFRTKILPIVQEIDSPHIQRINVLSPKRIKKMK